MTKKPKVYNLKSEKKIAPTGKIKTILPDNSKDYLNKKPAWRFTYCDTNSKYNISQCKESLFEKLKSFESMTYNEIFYKSNYQNHQISKNRNKDFDNYIKDKLNKYDLDESEPIYSLRLDNKTRIYGFIADDIFYILAYDDEHELYKVYKSHT